MLTNVQDLDDEQRVPDGSGSDYGILSFADPITTPISNIDAVGDLQTFSFAQADAVVPSSATLSLFLARLASVGRKKRQAGGYAVHDHKIGSSAIVSHNASE